MCKLVAAVNTNNEQIKMKPSCKYQQHAEQQDFNYRDQISFL